VDPVLRWLARPVGEFVFNSPTDAFLIRFKIAGVIGMFAAIPIMIYHLWRFVEIALYPSERSWVKFLVPSSCILFYFGMSLAFLGIAPIATHFLLQFSTPYLRPLISIEDYLSFLFWMIIGFGTLFQLPLVVIVLSRLGIIKPSVLARYRRHVIVGIVIVAAVLTPGPDVFSQMLLSIPSYLLFELSLLIARRLERPGERG
jgi:sec-independent protein translocase protein TatC